MQMTQKPDMFRIELAHGEILDLPKNTFGEIGKLSQDEIRQTLQEYTVIILTKVVPKALIHLDNSSADGLTAYAKLITKNLDEISLMLKGRPTTNHKQKS